MKKPTLHKIIKFFNNPMVLLLLVFTIYFLTGNGINHNSEQVQNIMSWTKGENLKSKDLQIIKSKISNENPTIAIITPEEMQKIALKLKESRERVPVNENFEKPLGGLEFSEEQVTSILKQMDEEAQEIEIPPEEIIALAEGLGKNWKEVLSYPDEAETGKSAAVLPDELKNHQENLKEYNDSIDDMMTSD